MARGWVIYSPLFDSWRENLCFIGTHSRCSFDCPITCTNILITGCNVDTQLRMSWCNRNGLVSYSALQPFRVSKRGKINIRWLEIYTRTYCEKWIQSEAHICRHTVPPYDSVISKAYDYTISTSLYRKQHNHIHNNMKVNSTHYRHLLISWQKTTPYVEKFIFKSTNSNLANCFSDTIPCTYLDSYTYTSVTTDYKFTGTQLPRCNHL